jgi:hypothetical protein
VDTPELAYTWTATSTSAREATRAFFRYVVERPRFYVGAAGYWVGLSALWYVVFDGDSTTWSRLFWAPIFGLVTTIVLFGAFISLLFALNLKRMRLRIQEGNIMESGFGEGVVRVRGPLSDRVLAASGIDWVRESGDWLLVRERGVPLIEVWPRALFPDPELARLRAAGPAA